STILTTTTAFTTTTATVTTFTTSGTTTATTTATTTIFTQDLGSWFTIFEHLAGTSVSPIGPGISTTAISTATAAIPSAFAVSLCAADCANLPDCSWEWFWTDQ